MRSVFRASVIGAAVCLAQISASLAQENPHRGDPTKPIELFVTPTGDDQASGSQNTPLATLHGAQNRLRELRSQANSAIEAQVWIAGGTYELSEPLQFTETDSSSASTTFEALPGQRVTLRGGQQLPSYALDKPTESELSRVPEQARPHVRVIELGNHGIDQVGDHPRRARHTEMSPIPFELFLGERRLPIAGWPNNQVDSQERTQSPLGQVPSGWSTVTGPVSADLSWHIDRALPELTLNSGARVHGFWQHDWQDSCEPVVVRATASGHSTLQIPASHREHVNAIRTGARFRIENVMAELDSPGEWYLDSNSHRLFVWLPESAQADDLFASTLETPVSFYDVENFTLRGLLIEGAKASAVEIAGGSQVTLDHCVIRHAGNLGVNIYHGAGHRVTNCDITSIGAGAIRVEGGDRETLSACEHVIEHNQLHDYAQLHLAYRPAVNVYGVGVTVRNNAIFNAPHSAIILHGNEHVIEHNDIHDVCQETDDVGAIYLAHNPTFRGNVIRHNHIHDLGGFSQAGVIAIYLDDFASGTSISHNLISRAGRGIAIGGGRDNLVENNVILDCLAAIQIDSRGQTWARHYVEGEKSNFALFCEEVQHDSDLYQERYPELANLLSDSPELAKGNQLNRNLFECPIGIDLHDGLNDKIVRLVDNFGNAKALLADTTGYELSPVADSTAARAGFEPIDLQNIGPTEREVFVSVRAK